MATENELKATLAAALEANDDDQILAVANELRKHKANIQKVAAEAARKEAEALAGGREKLARALQKEVNTPALQKRLREVKAYGFRFSIDRVDTPPGQAPVNVEGGTTLLVPEVKTGRRGAGGAAGKTKAEYGMTLQEVFDKFATDADREKLAAADGSTAEYNVKLAVKKNAIADKKLTPVS